GIVQQGQAEHFELLRVDGAFRGPVPAAAPRERQQKGRHAGEPHWPGKHLHDPLPRHQGFFFLYSSTLPFSSSVTSLVSVSVLTVSFSFESSPVGVRKRLSPSTLRFQSRL